MRCHLTLLADQIIIRPQSFEVVRQCPKRCIDFMGQGALVVIQVGLKAQEMKHGL